MRPDPVTDRIHAVALLSVLCDGVPSVVHYCAHEGNPIPMERPRVSRGRAFTPTRTRAAVRSLAWDLRVARGMGADLRGPVALAVLFFRADRRRCDVDNLLKTVLDAGTEARLWLDDSLVRAVAARVAVDREAPRTAVAWCEMPEAS